MMPVTCDSTALNTSGERSRTGCPSFVDLAHQRRQQLYDQKPDTVTNNTFERSNNNTRRGIVSEVKNLFEYKSNPDYGTTTRGKEKVGIAFRTRMVKQTNVEAMSNGRPLARGDRQTDCSTLSFLEQSLEDGASGLNSISMHAGSRTAIHLPQATINTAWHAPTQVVQEIYAPSRSSSSHRSTNSPVTSNTKPGTAPKPLMSVKPLAPPKPQRCFRSPEPLSPVNMEPRSPAALVGKLPSFSAMPSDWSKGMSRQCSSTPSPANSSHCDSPRNDRMLRRLPPFSTPTERELPSYLQRYRYPRPDSPLSASYDRGLSLSASVDSSMYEGALYRTTSLQNYSTSLGLHSSSTVLDADFFKAEEASPHTNDAPLAVAHPTRRPMLRGISKRCDDESRRRTWSPPALARAVEAASNSPLRSYHSTEQLDTRCEGRRESEHVYEKVCQSPSRAGENNYSSGRELQRKRVAKSVDCLYTTEQSETVAVKRLLPAHTSNTPTTSAPFPHQSPCHSRLPGGDSTNHHVKELATTCAKSPSFTIKASSAAHHDAVAVQFYFNGSPPHYLTQPTSPTAAFTTSSYNCTSAATSSSSPMTRKHLNAKTAALHSTTSENDFSSFHESSHAALHPISSGIISPPIYSLRTSRSRSLHPLSVAGTTTTGYYTDSSITYADHSYAQRPTTSPSNYPSPCPSHAPSPSPTHRVSPSASPSHAEGAVPSAVIESALRDKAAQLEKLRVTMEQNEVAMVRCAGEERAAWAERLAEAGTDWRRALERERERAVDVEAGLHRHVQRLTQDGAALRQDCEALRAERSRLQVALDAALRDHHVLQEQHAACSIQLSTARASMDEGVWALQEKCGEVALLKRHLREAQDTLAARNMDLVTARAQLRDARREMESTLTEASGLREESGTAQQQLEERERGITLLQQQATEREAEMAAVTHTCEASRAEVAHLQRKVQERDEVIARLNAASKEHAEKESDLTCSHHEAEAKFREKDQYILLLEKQVGEKNVEIVCLKDEASEHKLKQTVTVNERHSPPQPASPRLPLPSDSAETPPLPPSQPPPTSMVPTVEEHAHALAQFEQERSTWLTEKAKVLRYHQQLQLNYVQMARQNKQLHSQVTQLLLEVENKELRLSAENRESSC